MLPRFLKLLYYLTIVGGFCANMIVVSQTTTLGVLGAGLALRGPDGSMMTATDGLYEERDSVFFVFGIGLACTVGSVVVAVWIILHWEAALCCMLLTLLTGRTIWTNFRRVQQRFDFDESETVDFRDIMEGPAAIQAIPWSGLKRNIGKWSKTNQHNNAKKSASMPLEVENGYDEDEWSHPSSHSSSQRLLRRQNNDVKRRRGRSGSPNQESQEHMIQTI